MTPSELSTLSEEGRELDRLLVRGIAWTGAMKWLSQLLSWSCTILVARLLTPADYGVFGMATVFFGLVSMANEFGLGTAVVTLPKLRTEQIAQVNGLSVLMGLAAFAISCVAASPL